MSAIPAMSRPASEADSVRREVPPIPDRLADTGLSADFVRDLLLKTLYVQGARTGQQLTEFVWLPFGLVDEQLLTLQQRRFVEVRSTIGPNRGSYIFDLVGDGRDRARDAFEASQYVGPAPVPLQQYRLQMEAQSIQHAHVTQPRAARGPEPPRAGREAVRHPRSGDQLVEVDLPLRRIRATARPPSPRRSSQMLGGAIYLPYAVEIDGQIMVVYDPVHHELVPSDEAGDASDGIWLRTGPGHDRRYAYVRRPIVITGGELTLDQLDLQYDPFTKLYQAPFQVKANGGVLIVDDFGRQRVPPRDLLNRWIVPLEKRIDYLTLHTGGKFPIPFDCLLIFATNLDPKELVEEAFLRRIHYKISIEDPTTEGYELIFRRCCEAEGVAYEPAALAQVYRDFYQGLGIPARACHPRDILAHVADIAKYHDTTPRLTPELVDLACRSYFLTDVHDH